MPVEEDWGVSVGKIQDEIWRYVVTTCVYIIYSVKYNLGIILSVKKNASKLNKYMNGT